VLDTGNEESRTAFAAANPALLEGLAGLAREVRTDEMLFAHLAQIRDQEHDRLFAEA
jgi:hypothetical protein